MDDVGTDPGTGEPNAPEVNGAGAPVVREKPSAEAPAAVSTKNPEAEPKKETKPRTDDDDFEDLLKKKGGLKYKVAGKEKAVTSAADLRRILSKIDGTEAAAGEALRAKQEAEGIKARVNALAKMRPEERLKALAGMGIDPKHIREAFEQQIVGEDDHQKELAALTPQERAFRAEREAFEAERSEFVQQKEREREEQEQAEYVAKVQQTGERLTKATVGALQKAKIAGEHAPRFLAAIADRLDRNERLGLGLDEDELAEVVVKEHESLADSFYSGLDVPALADKLEGIAIDDPEQPGKKTTRLKLLMKECARRIRAQHTGGQPAPVRVVPAQSRQSDKPQTREELMDAARTFGGGVHY